MCLPRTLTLHCLRHTSVTFDAPFREMKELQADLRHKSLNATHNTNYKMSGAWSWRVFRTRSR